MINKKQFYIDGEWVNPQIERDCEVINPATEKVCSVISLGSSEDTNRAVSAAKEAFLPWSQTPLQKRIELLTNLQAIYLSRKEEMAQAMSTEMGAPISLASRNQFGAGSYHIGNLIDELKKFEFEHSLPEDPHTMILHEPIGVCGLITPWNWPMNQITLKVIPALGTGCTMVLKPSELSPLSALLFTEMIDQAGFPPGVFNLVNGDGAGVGTDLSTHPDVNMISFTGSTRAGVAISKNAADTIKRVSLELGGKGANIVFADAKEEAVSWGVRYCFQNSGQSCNAPTRMLVERAIYDQAVKEAIEAAKEIQVGQPTKEGRHIGPVVSRQQYDKIQALIQQGIDDGAKLVVGGLGKPEGVEQGYFVRPTLFVDANNKMTVAREEVFGPVLTIIPFDSEEEAIEIANDTNFGLTNYINTLDYEKAKRVARQLRSGMVEINGNDRGTGAPFGGYKQSGNGREGGVWGVEDFLEVKAVSDWQ